MCLIAKAKSSSRCKLDQYLENDICKPCWPQSPYYDIISNCTDTSNAMIRCKEHFYFDPYFEKDPCRICTVCEEGFSIAEPCSETNNTICCPQKGINCHKPSTNSTNSTPTFGSTDDSLKPDEANVNKKSTETNIVYIVVAIVCGLIVIVGVFLLFLWWMFKRYSGDYETLEPRVDSN